MKQAVTPARAGTAREAAVLARCIGIVAATGQRCRQMLSLTTVCLAHARWVPPMFYMDAQVTRTPGNGKCAMCVRGLGPHVCWERAT